MRFPTKARTITPANSKSLLMEDNINVSSGLAYLGSACNPDYYFSIVEEYFEFRDVAIAAHELGHR